MADQLSMIYRWALVFLTTLSSAAFVSTASFAQAERPASFRSSDSIVYHGKIVRPDGSVPTGNVTTTIKIYSPEPSRCLLWAESQSVPVKNGSFSAEIGYSENRISGPSGGAAQSFREVFINNPGLVHSSAQCDSGSSYVPGNSDDRLMSATFQDGGTTVIAELIAIKSVPFAKQAAEVGGFSIDNLMKISGAGSSVQFSPDEVARIKSISSGGSGNQIIGLSGSGSIVEYKSITAGAGILVTHSAGGIQISATGGGGSGSVTNVDVSGLPLSVVNGSSTPTISIAPANSSQAGYLTSADWTLFNSKQPAGAYLTSINGAQVTAALGYTPISSTSSSEVISALGFTPLSKSGDTVTGDFGLANEKYFKLGSFASDPDTSSWSNAEKGRAWFNTTSNQVKYWDGSSIQSLGVSGAGLTSLNGQSGSTQSFAAGSSGTDFGISSSGNTHTFNLPSASGTARGLLTSADWSSFNAKQPAGAYLTSITSAQVNAALGYTPMNSASSSQVISALGFTPQADLGFNPVSNALPSGQTYIGNGSNLAVAGFFGVGQLRNSSGTVQFPASCAASQTLTWSAVTDVFSCSNIGSLPASAITSGTIDSARLPFGANLWQDGGSGKVFYNGGNVGIGTSSPVTRFEVSGDSQLTSGSPSLTLKSTSGELISIKQFGDGTFNWTNKNGTTRLYMDANGRFGIGDYGGGYMLPANKLDVNGSMTIGIPFSGVPAVSDAVVAPSNGLLVAGNVGIGTTSPSRLLHVNGPMRVTASALPGTPATGDIAVDSGDSNKLKWYDGSGWQAAGGSGGGRTSCPAGFSLVGTSGSMEAYCISTNEETSATWLNAVTNCSNKTPAARLCSASEWVHACVKAGTYGISNMTGNWEWVADLNYVLRRSSHGQFGL